VGLRRLVHSRLPVRSMIQAPEAVRPYGVIPGELTLSFFEDVENFIADCGGPDRIKQNFHADTGLRFARQGMREFSADLAGPIDVGLDRDRELRGVDRVQHGRKELVPVVENLEEVAFEERNAGRPRHRRKELFGLDPELMFEPETRWDLRRPA